MDKEIKQGYKQTKVGIIPEHWQVVRLGDICKFYKGKGISKDNLSEEGIPCIRYGELYTTYNEKIDNVISKTNVDIKELFLSKSNDIIIPASGETAIDIATASCVLLDNVALSGDINVIRTRENGIFLSYYLNAIAKSRIASLAQGVSVVHLYSTQLENLSLSLPTLKEQEKIAKILNTWDEAIRKQEKLIELQELQKKALMKKLLSGEVRFDEFNDKWEELKLRDICYIKKGDQLNKDTLDSYGNFPVINGGVEPSGYTKEWNTEENTITISEGGNSCGHVNFIQDKFWSGGHCYTLLNLKIDKKFLFQFLKYNQHNIMKLRVGSGLPNIQKSAIEKFSVNKPSLPEQQKIAGVLSLADDEINFLRNELKELKLQKKALMQKLLTGEVRIDV
ncbi:restriction endonuclease subunit S [Aliarcobacter butzleri]|uniref:restriction endonuclease subunit S n=1 Tax=Aliarcobacter butzleri TaxID=28197 RepID=UPI00344E2AE1